MLLWTRTLQDSSPLPRQKRRCNAHVQDTPEGIIAAGLCTPAPLMTTEPDAAAMAFAAQHLQGQEPAHPPQSIFNHHESASRAPFHSDGCARLKVEYAKAGTVACSPRPRNVCEHQHGLGSWFPQECGPGVCIRLSPQVFTHRCRSRLKACKTRTQMGNIWLCQAQLRQSPMAVGPQGDCHVGSHMSGHQSCASLHMRLGNRWG